jgi:hypothetical protein
MFMFTAILHEHQTSVRVEDVPRGRICPCSDDAALHTVDSRRNFHSESDEVDPQDGPIACAVAHYHQLIERSIVEPSEVLGRGPGMNNYLLMLVRGAEGAEVRLEVEELGVALTRETNLTLPNSRRKLEVGVLEG